MAELSKTYDPKSVEPKWYARWIDNHDFEADPNSGKSEFFSIVMPPPNITGVLTLGHVLNNTIQDILARRARMQGKEVLWLPGMDHAGIGTQTAVEKWLRKNEGVTRHDLGRQEFLRRVLDWQDKHGGIIIQQLKRLGCSADWSRQRYTFDDNYILAVEKVFVDLYKKGLIDRGRRMINWDPAAQTALSDEEVINKPQRGNLYYVRYEIVDQPGKFLEVATTRPETIMADTGVAVHPKDKRYVDLIGKEVWRPLPREKIPVVADEAIDPEFGTGVLKVTPAHDKVDFKVGQRHKLSVIDVLHPDGRINCPAVPELNGLDRFEARKRAAELLQERGLLSKTEPYENNVGFSDRSEVPIEPRISEQWFLKYPKTEEALAVVRDHLIRFFPAHWEKVYAQWLENIQDWCISRQVWWGHRIPVWIHRTGSLVRPQALPKKFLPDFSATDLSGGKEVSLSGLPSTRTFLRHEEYYRDDRSMTTYAATTDPAEIAELERNGFVQDPDTLDTWFSSWLWAYETMDAKTRKRFYPTSVLVTGPDIIFFWVARMIIAGLEFLPKEPEEKRAVDFSELSETERTDLYKRNIPFEHVYFTGIIRDKQGRKMSKSLGNSPDPLELIDKYGADGLRFGLMRIAPSGQDIRFDEKQIEEGRNFATKLWNAARFRQMHGPSSAQPKIGERESLSIYADEILARLDQTLDVVEAAYQEYQFNVVAQALYNFVWNDYCDWYVEAAKSEILGEDVAKRESALKVMDYVLNAILRLLHPFMPHVTEELWATFSFEGGSIHFQPRPQKLKRPFPSRNATVMIYELVEAGRNLRAEARVPSNQKVKFALRTSDPAIAAEQPTIERLLNASELIIDSKARAGMPVATTQAGELVLVVEVDRATERERLAKEIAKLETELKTVKAKLANKSFVDRAPAAVVEEHRRRQKNFAEQLKKLKEARKRL
jgi:valyl-tRNA synthetase